MIFQTKTVHWAYLVIQFFAAVKYFFDITNKSNKILRVPTPPMNTKVKLPALSDFTRPNFVSTHSFFMKFNFK